MASEAPGIGRPGRRPADYSGSEGWAQRIVSRTSAAAVVGLGVGAALGATKGQGLLRWAGIVASNGALATAGFCSAQELVRELRAAHPEDLVNCVLGGVASGALLGRLQGGPSRVLPCALLFATVGTALQFGSIEIREYRLRKFMEGLPGLDLPPVEVNPLPAKDWQFPEWFPIQRLTKRRPPSGRSRGKRISGRLLRTFGKGEAQTAIDLHKLGIMQRRWESRNQSSSCTLSLRTHLEDKM